MKTELILLMVVGAVALTGGCAHVGGNGTPTTAADLAAARSGLLQTDRAFSRLSETSGVANAFAAYLADDATLLPMNEPLIQGRQTIRAHLESGPVGAVLVWTPLQADVSRSRDLGYTFGTYELRIPGTNGPPTVRHGKYVSIWKRQADGSWKIVVDTGNPNPPPEGGLVPLPRE